MVSNMVSSMGLSYNVSFIVCELIVVTTAKIPNEIDNAPSLFLIIERKFITTRYYRIFSFSIGV